MKNIVLILGLFLVLSSCDKTENQTTEEQETVFQEVGGKIQYPHDFYKQKVDNIDNPQIFKTTIFADYSKNKEASKDTLFYNEYIESVCFQLSVWHHNNIFYQWPHFYGVLLPHTNDPEWEDLNQDAGGKYIYAFVRGTTDQYEAVTAFNVATTSRNRPPANTCLNADNGISPADLNDGAGGDYVWAIQERTVGHKMQGLGTIMGNSSAIQPPAGWVKIPVDLNKGAGGLFIYFIVKWVN